MCKRFASALALVAVITLAAGCTTTETLLVRTPLPVPQRPTLPLIEPQALACLDDATYEAMATRDAMLQAHIRQLEAILNTTHSGGR